MSSYTLAFGKTGLEITLPSDLDITVIEPEYQPGLPDAEASLRAALRDPIASPPLRDLVRARDKVGIVFSDITRPAPNHLLIPALLAELAHVPKGQIVLFNGLGTHRPNTAEELATMLGRGLVDDYRLVQNDAFDPQTQIHLGTSQRGHEIWLNRELVECDVKILTGFIEPHFFAGFSGGPKAAMPGMAGQQTVLANHDAVMIGDPTATWAVTWGNPIWEEIREITHLIDPTLLLNVSLNRDREVTGVFAGALDEAHAAGCAYVKRTAMVPVPDYFDIVITSNSGYPLDLNLYQAVKGMSAAAQITRPGGAIIIAADCWDGIPEHGAYGQLLREAASPQDLLARIHSPGFLMQDQWQAQIQVQIQLVADVYVHTKNLDRAQVESCLLRYSPSVEETIAELLTVYDSPRICVLPDGPQTVPYVGRPT